MAKIPPIQTALRPTIGSKHARLAGFKGSELSEAIASKMVEGLNTAPKRFENGEAQITPPNMLVNQVANNTAQNVIDAENMMQLLPDLELAKQVLVSSILSPNDMMSCELSYLSTADDLGDAKPLMLNVIKDYFENTYKIKPQLSHMLEEALFTKGAYPIAVIPESSIDNAINSSKKITLESLKDEVDGEMLPRSYGILGNPSGKASGGFGFGIESFDGSKTAYTPVNEMLSLMVTDNINVLKFPRIHEKLVADRVNDAYSSKKIGMEVFNGKGTDEMERDSLYKPRNFNYTPIVTLKTLEQLDKETVGHPLVLTLPVEAVIPVHVPSSPEEHVGYFVVLDKHGNPVRANSTQDYFADLSYNTNNIRDMSSQMLAHTRRASEGRRPADDQMLLEESVNLYTEVIEKDLMSRLRSGIYGENVQISKPTEIYRMMFARACSRMMTQLVYVPNTLMTYVAFDYNQFGVGKSLLEATKIIGSIRAMLLFSNTIASIKNSVSHVAVNIELDPADPSPDRTVEFLMNEYAKTRQASYPIGASSPVDMINYLQNAGVQVITSGHPGYPETKVSLEENATNHVKVDTDLDEVMKKRQLMAVGLAPETVDLSMNVDFATSVVNSNILLAKRALIYQEKFCIQLASFFQKFTCNSRTLMDKLREIVDNNKAKFKNGSNLKTDAIVLYFINSLEVELPSPDLSRLEMQMEGFDNYTKGLDMVLPAFVSSDLFDSESMGEIANSIPRTIAVLKAHFQRHWLQENNVMPELFKLTAYDKDKDAAFDLLKDHELYMISLQKSLITFMTTAVRASAETNKALQVVQDATGVEVESSGDTGGDSGGDESAGDEGGDEVDDFDFGGGDEGGDAGDTGDEATDEEADAEEEPKEDDKEEEPVEEPKEDEDK